MTRQSVIALMGLVFLLASCSPERKESPRGEKIFEVRTLPVTYSTSYLEYKTGGFFEAVFTVEVAPEVSGKVVRIFAEEGDQVKEGDPLLKIEDSVYRKAYEEALWELKQAQRDYENQKALLERREALYRKELISKEEFEEVRTRVEVLRARIESLRVRLESRKLDLERTLLKSPLDGVILSRGVSVGDYVTPQKVTYVILKTDPLRFVFKVPQEIVSHLRRGTPVEVVADGRRVRAEVTYISPSADSNRLFSVKALIRNGEGFFKPNAYGEVFFGFKRIRAVSVPEQAVQLSRGQSFLWVVRESRAVRVPVRVIRHEGDKLLVVGELKEGDRVIVEGLLFLYEGAKVVER